MDRAQRERVGRRLRGLRVEQGLRQIDIAERAHTSVGTVQGVEGGVRDTREETIDKIATALGTSIAEILREEAVPARDAVLSNLNREDVAVALAYQRASSRIREHVRDLLRQREEPEGADHLQESDREHLTRALRKLPDADRELIERALAAGRQGSIKRDG